ncbi:MAG TPA: right-handed parallel beta-helix repeat-containing protein [Thermomicrobiaceae bacterium]|nr:right-handed parallel beta-helix repeat-containing protein [Thermomicrobiaceae bacterium]
MNAGVQSDALRGLAQRAIRLAGALVLGLGLTIAGGIALAAPVAADGACQPAGDTGMTAAVVAQTGDTITGTIDATGCNIGVFVGPDATRAVIRNATIQHADDHGIYIQNTHDVMVVNNVVSNNGVNPHLCPAPGTPPTGPCTPEDKAIQLDGTYSVVVRGNTVENNLADGGIAINDEGPLNTGAFNPATLAPGRGNQIVNNTVLNNPTGCGIVISSYNAGAGVYGNTVRNNTVKGNSVGIVVAADSPSTIANFNRVSGNTISDNAGPGVVIHSNTPGDQVNGNLISLNKISGNGGFGPQTWGIALLGEVNPVTNTVVVFNRVTQEDADLYQQNTVNTISN